MLQANRNVASFNTIIEILQNDQSKIKLIRKYENTRKKIINNECAILFNKTCINERLLPKYINIYMNIDKRVKKHRLKEIAKLVCANTRTNPNALIYISDKI